MIEKEEDLGLKADTGLQTTEPIAQHVLVPLVQSKAQWKVNTVRPRPMAQTGVASREVVFNFFCPLDDKLCQCAHPAGWLNACSSIGAPDIQRKLGNGGSHAEAVTSPQILIFLFFVITGGNWTAGVPCWNKWEGRSWGHQTCQSQSDLQMYSVLLSYIKKTVTCWGSVPLKHNTNINE